MASKINRHLWAALDLKISEVARIDLGVGVLFAAAALVLSFVNPAALLRTVSNGVQIVGVIVGAVIAAISFIAAFMDQAFLRKLRAIDSDPVYYLAPFLFTAVIGVLAMLALIVMSTLSAKSPVALIAVISTPTALLTVWTITSLIPGLATMVQFVGLKMDALDVPDDVGPPTPRDSSGKEPERTHR